MLLKIDFESELPIYEQMKRQIIQGIAVGNLVAGEILPSVRQMAEDIGINLHTVNKAYNILKGEGYLTIDRRKGAIINDKLPKITEETNTKLIEELNYIIADSKCRGFTKEEFLDLCSKIFNNYSRK
ncbi:GntR family transcriptional regulator [Clostridium rectalis]|uniref:GntR family transcriptional regulator n=1 Tax=Clostridium rectalis TaxID=2040295 RepID=UPI000F62F552|nr:GntR family transcriptional regulator [Clostridium rectalis]